MYTCTCVYIYTYLYIYMFLNSSAKLAPESIETSVQEGFTATTPTAATIPPTTLPLPLPLPL